MSIIVKEKLYKIWKEVWWLIGGDVVAHWRRCGGSLVAHQTSRAEVLSSNRVSPTMITMEDNCVE